MLLPNYNETGIVQRGDLFVVNLMGAALTYSLLNIQQSLDRESSGVEQILFRAFVTGKDQQPVF